jgi:hypothetical protein
MSQFAFDWFEPISVSSVPPGWRAVYEFEEDPGWQTLPLIGWGVFRVKILGGPTAEVLREESIVLEGVVLEPIERFPICALALPGWWNYLGPDEPDPEPGKPRPKRDLGKRRPSYRFTPAGERR